jgi:uracil-DNA glycosylase
MSDSFPYEDDKELQEVTSNIAVCRDGSCPVVQRHPFYPVPEEPPLYYGKRPCMPVVPVFLARGKVMVIGEYPNCRFATVPNKSDSKPVPFVPVADIDEPFVEGRYFNAQQVAVYPTGESLRENYLNPLGLSLQTDIWLTNMVKCFLLQTKHITTYSHIGWIGPGLPSTHESYDEYFSVAARCAVLHLAGELQLCQPRLVIGLGERVYRMIHSQDNFQIPATDPGPFANVAGTPFRAGLVEDPHDLRVPPFKDFNIVHLTHPSRLLREPDVLDHHLQVDIPRVKNFMLELGL